MKKERPPEPLREHDLAGRWNCGLHRLPPLDHLDQAPARARPPVRHPVDVEPVPVGGGQGPGPAPPPAGAPPTEARSRWPHISAEGGGSGHIPHHRSISARCDKNSTRWPKRRNQGGRGRRSKRRQTCAPAPGRTGPALALVRRQPEPELPPHPPVPRCGHLRGLRPPPVPASRAPDARQRPPGSPRSPFQPPER